MLMAKYLYENINIVPLHQICTDTEAQFIFNIIKQKILGNFYASRIIHLVSVEDCGHAL